MPDRQHSGGGLAVQHSLTALDFDVSTPGVSLVETASPLRRHARVMAQNAWTVIPRSEFRRLIARYPAKHRIRNVARRIVARTNLRRADDVVCLSSSMADLVAAVGVDPVVAPVSVPVDVLRGITPTRPSWMPDARFVLVPGTITWYKRTHQIVPILRSLDEAGLGPFHCVLAGGDDGSGCLGLIARSIPAERWSTASVDRSEMVWLLRHAEATLLLSDLESLSFSMGEALWLSQRVVASDIPVHREVAERLQLVPAWFDGTPDGEAVIAALAGPSLRNEALNAEQRLSEWIHVGISLGLASKPRDPRWS